MIQQEQGQGEECPTLTSNGLLLSAGSRRSCDELRTRKQLPFKRHMVSMALRHEAGLQSGGLASKIILFGDLQAQGPVETEA